MSLRACVLAALACACDARPREPVDVARSELAVVADAPAPVSSVRAVVAPALTERFPALAFHPGVTPRLLAALAPGGPARERMLAFAASMEPFRWESATSWDNLGFVATAGPVTGFVTRRAGSVVAQDPGMFDLGCAGGFLEGVRLVLLPTLTMDELAACDPSLAERVTGAPERCAEPGDFGRLAIANIVARLDAARLPDGSALVDITLDQTERLAALRAPDAAHLCTVSHTSLVHRGRRFHHHMMIVLGTPRGDAYDVFDTTGSRGVALQRMRDARLATYVGGLLAANRDYRYAPASARLTCVRVQLATAD